jgi:hypothetical protein
VKIQLEGEVDEKTPYTLTERLHGKQEQEEGVRIRESNWKRGKQSNVG